MGIFDSIGSLFSGSGMQEAEQARQAELNKGYERYVQAAGQGRDFATDYYTRAVQPYLQMQGTGNAGYQAYADASGANGPEGLARAQSNFRASPGLAFMQQQAQQALERSGVAGGRATGNILQSVTDRAANLGLQDWNNYVENLKPWLGEGQRTAAGIGGIYTGLGGLVNQSYLGQGNQAMNLGQQLGQSRYAEEFAPTMGAQNLVNLGMQGLMAAANFAAPGAGTLMKAAGSGLWNMGTNNFLGSGSFRPG